MEWLLQGFRLANYFILEGVLVHSLCSSYLLLHLASFYSAWQELSSDLLVLEDVVYVTAGSGDSLCKQNHKFGW